MPTPGRVISKKAALAEYIPKRECLPLVLGSLPQANVGGVRGQELEIAFLILYSSEEERTLPLPAFAWAQPWADQCRRFRGGKATVHLAFGPVTHTSLV